MPGDRCAIQNHAAVLEMEETARSTTPFGLRLMLNNTNPPQGVFVWCVRPLCHSKHSLGCPSGYGVNNEAGFGLQCYILSSKAFRSSKVDLGPLFTVQDCQVDIIMVKFYKVVKQFPFYSCPWVIVPNGDYVN